MDRQQTLLSYTITEIPALTSLPNAASAGSTSIQQDDFWSLRLSNLELRVSNPAEQKLRTA